MTLIEKLIEQEKRSVAAWHRRARKASLAERYAYNRWIQHGATLAQLEALKSQEEKRQTSRAAGQVGAA